jgi:Holliday junction resolvase RusA-like endonuclease
MRLRKQLKINLHQFGIYNKGVDRVNKKELQEYHEKYGNVPKNFYERFNYVLNSVKFSQKDIEKLQHGAKKLLKAKWEELNFVIYFLPKSTPRPRSGKHGFYVKGAADNSKAFKEFIENSEDDFGIITTATKFLVDIYIPTPNQMNKHEKILSELKLIRPVVKPDWDNAGKTYSDMIQKHLLLDDSVIVDGRTRKFYSARPRIEIKMKFMTKYDCRFNKKKVENWKFYEELEDKILERDSIM